VFTRGYMHPDKFFEFGAIRLARCSRMHADVLACGGGEEAAIHRRSRHANDPPKIDAACLVSTSALCRRPDGVSPMIVATSWVAA